MKVQNLSPGVPVVLEIGKSRMHFIGSSVSDIVEDVAIMGDAFGISGDDSARQVPLGIAEKLMFPLFQTGYE